MRTLRNVLTCSALLVLSTMLWGCGPNRNMSVLNVKVNADTQSLGQPLPSMDVDLVGVTEDEKPKWEQQRMSEYWRAQSQLRADRRQTIYTMSFGAQAPTSQTLSAKDPIWNAWKSAGARYLFVMANLPGLHSDEAGAQDHRRLILPLEKYRWNGHDINVTVTGSGMSVTPAPNPAK